MLEFTFVKDLKNFLPKICSEYFKALNREYNVMNKTLVLIVQGLENIMIKTLEIQKVNEKIDLNIKYKNLLSFKDSRNQIQEKDETILRITSFLEIFYKNLERNNYNLKIAKAFMHFILETIDIFLQSSALKWLILIYIYFNNVSFENNNNEIDSLYKKLVTKEEYQIITVITFLKEELLLYIKHIERLPLDLDSKIFLKTFRVLKDIFYLTDLHFYKGTTNLKELKAFHFEEAETIAKTFLKTFCIKSLKNTKIEINEQMLEINLFSTKVLEKESIYINEEKTFNFQTRKIIDNFELMNFDENVFFSINEMFLKIESSLAFYLFEFYFHKLAEFRYSFEDQPPIKEIISLLFLSNQMISRMINYSFYCKNWLNFLLSNPKICKVYDEYLIKYIELLLGFDYLPSEDLRYHIADYKVIFEMLKIQGINLSFLLINHDYQSNFLNKFNIIYYLLEKYVENDSFLKTLIEKHLAYFIFCLEKEKNVSDFLDKYMSNLINRIILQIRSIQILENKLQPFKVFHAILMLIENDEKGIVMFHMFCMDVWTTLSKCFDKYYILSDKKFIHLMLVIIKQIMRIIAKKHQIVTLNDDENLKFNEVNLIRQILLRIKPLITNKNNEIMVLSNEIFKESLIIIHSKFFFIIFLFFN